MSNLQKEFELPECLKNTIFGSENFVSLYTIGDGSCLLHAVYNAMNLDNYRSKSREEKIKYIIEKRNELATYYDELSENEDELYKKYKYSIFRKENISEKVKQVMEKIISIEPKNIDKESEIIIKNDNMLYLGATHEYLGQEVINLIEHFEKINIIIIFIDKDLFKPFDFICMDQNNSNENENVIIKFYENHYEPLVKKTESYQGSFKSDSEIVKNIREMCEMIRTYSNTKKQISPTNKRSTNNTPSTKNTTMVKPETKRRVIFNIPSTNRPSTKNTTTVKPETKNNSTEKTKTVTPQSKSNSTKKTSIRVPSLKNLFSLISESNPRNSKSNSSLLTNSNEFRLDSKILILIVIIFVFIIFTASTFVGY